MTWAGRATELWRLHVFNGAVGELSADQNIRNGCESKKPQQPMHCGFAIESLLYQAFLNLTLAQIDANRNQHQTHKEHYRNDEKDDDPGVRVINVAPLGVGARQRATRSVAVCNERQPDQTQPMPS